MKFFALVFLPLMLLFSGCEAERIALSRAIDDSRVKLRLAVMAETEVGWLNETKGLERAFRYFKQEKVDALVIVSGATKNGYKNQFEVLEQVRMKVFGKNGAKIILEEGEHEIKGCKFATSKTRSGAKSELLTFYGGEKLALTDEFAFYPRNGRKICAGSMSGLSLSRGYEVPKSQEKISQALLVSFYADETVIKRLDFTFQEPKEKVFGRPKGHIWAEEVAAPWVIPVHGEVPQAMTKTAEFSKNATISVISGYRGFDEIKTVRWPAVVGNKEGGRAFAYELSIAYENSPKLKFYRKTILAPRFFAAAEREPRAVDYVIKVKDLPSPRPEQGRFLLSTIPISALGERGKPLTTLLD